MVFFQVADAISDNMVLQRDTSIRIWGTGPSGKQIKVVFSYESAETLVDDRGDWIVYLLPRIASSSPTRLTVSCEDCLFIFENILIGDVWLIGGQSNADMTFHYNEQIYQIHESFIAEGRASDHIRLLEQQRNDALENPESMKTPQRGFVNKEKSTWRIAEGIESIANFSALGYCFARYLTGFLESQIPIGVVMAAAGAAALVELMPQELADAMGHPRNPEGSFMEVASMYNALMSPIQNMSIRGMIFYQGESEQFNNAFTVYPYRLNWYVAELRRRFHQNFPFLFVQLSSHGGSLIEEWNHLEDVRNCQFDALNLISNSHLVTSMDVGWKNGDIDCAHPNYKLPIGERLAKVALAMEYKTIDLEYAGCPLPEKASFGKDSVTVWFRCVADGLKPLLGSGLRGFEICGDDNIYVQGIAKISGKNSVVVSGILHPIGIRYAYMHLAYTENANLGNSEKLPCCAFELKK